MSLLNDLFSTLEKVSRFSKYFHKNQVHPDLVDKNWKKWEEQFIIFVAKWLCEKKIKINTRSPIGIVVSPWIQTAVPWFSITMGLFLANRGNRVTFIFDDIENGIEDKVTFQYQVDSIQKILSRISDRFEIIQLSRLKIRNSLLTGADNTIINSLAKANAIHFFRGETNENSNNFTQNLIQIFTKKLFIIHDILYQNSFSSLLLPGGIWGSSGLFLKIAREKNIRINSYDAGFGILLISTNGVAAHQTDIPIAMSLLDKAELKKIIEIAYNELDRRKEARPEQSDFVPSFQKIGFINDSSTYNVGILLLLNQVCDTAALGLEKIFDSTIEWIFASIEWTLNNCDEIITIRQHPIERTEFGRTNDDYSNLIRSRYGNNKRIKFISAEDEVNTYKVINLAKCVITFSSTTALEAVMMDKPVITITECYYSNLGFVLKPISKEEYFSHIDSCINGNYKTTLKQKTDAATCYYLTQCCNRINTTFTGQPSDFEKWVKKSPKELSESEEINDVLTSIEEGVPISLIRHRKNNENF